MAKKPGSPKVPVSQIMAALEKAWFIMNRMIYSISERGKLDTDANVQLRLIKKLKAVETRMAITLLIISPIPRTLTASLNPSRSWSNTNSPKSIAADAKPTIR